MKLNGWLFAGILFCGQLFSQELPASQEQPLENITEAAETEDDQWLVDLEDFRRHRLDINRADATDWQQLRLVNDYQIRQLQLYIERLGPLLHVHELQAVPGWSPDLVRQLLPFMRAGINENITETIRRNRHADEHMLLFRMSQTLEKARGFLSNGTAPVYPGSPQRILLRYRYRLGRLGQLGFLGDKDAGEPFFRRPGTTGFDFHSFHAWWRPGRMVQAVALGDYTISLGQGLVHWQGLAFRKSAETAAIKRQGAPLRPYQSPGEAGFHRGAAVWLRHRRWEWLAFVSRQRISANTAMDSSGTVITSFLTSGLHRSAAEREDRNRVRQTAAGVQVGYRGGRGQIGLHTVYHLFSLPVLKQPEPYNRFALAGSRWLNAGIHYSYTWRNLHFFGESAVDGQGDPAFVHGVLWSLSTRVDAALLHRHLSPRYQSVQGQAFTESTRPSNEQGFYAGLVIRPFPGWRLDAYADSYRFPWLRFQTDAPGGGHDWLLQLTRSPLRGVEWQVRLRTERRPVNTGEGPMAVLGWESRHHGRVQVQTRAGGSFILRMRADWVFYEREGHFPEQGMAGFSELLYRPVMKPFQGSVRLHYFDTEGYNSRVYAYEQDVAFSYSIPAFFDRGWRYYFNFQYKCGRHWTFWLRWAQTFYPEKKNLGSGWDEIAGGRRSEWRFQGRLVL